MTEQDVRLPQPREGVTGIDRDDWMLALDTRALAHRDALAALAFHLQTASLVGNPAPNTRQVYERISTPHVGDLVVEMTYWFPNRDEDHRAKSLGILIERRREWATTDADWEADLAAEQAWNTEHGFPSSLGLERVSDEAWYIQYGNDADDVCRWTNCRFLAVPINPREFRP